MQLPYELPWLQLPYEYDHGYNSPMSMTMITTAPCMICKMVHKYKYCVLWTYSQTCIKKSPLGQSKIGLIRQVTS